MSHLGTMYATKRRRRNSKSVRVPPKDSQTKSNPSKRHRERLNAELDTLASLLPFEHSVLTKLDKLSILRLSVSYLRTKSYFQTPGDGDSAEMSSLINKNFSPVGNSSISLYHSWLPAVFHRDLDRQDHGHKSRDILYPDMLMEGDLILQALNGFLLILTCDGEVFYASHTVETYLGFHQSDICHQSVYELVHSEDREELQRHLMWNAQLPADRGSITLQEVLLPENAQHLERNFTVRFRCLLDNTSGFLRLDIRGRVKVLHGQNHKTEDPPMALFAVCTPFGPPSLLEMPQKDSMFKSKHKLDLSLVSIDQRGKQVLGYTDSDLANKGGYDLVHFDDLAYVASAHQELLKTGASGLIAYRLSTKEGQWQWLQTSARLVYKNSKPDFILCTHRPLMEEEGRDLLGKRTMDFKVTYLDGGLGAITDRSGLLSDGDLILRCQRTRRYKSQFRELLTTCRKRKIPGDPYIDETSYNNVYPYPTENVNGLTPYATAMPQNFFTAAIDNTRLLAPENLFHYRHLTGGYYPEYHPAAQYSGNGFLDMTTTARTCFPTPYPPDGSQLTKDEKLYPCQIEAAKFNGEPPRLMQQMGSKPSCCEAYVSPADPSAALRYHMGTTGAGLQQLLPSLDRDPTKLADLSCRNLNFGLPGVVDPLSVDCVNVIKPKTTSALPTHLRDSPHLAKEEKLDHSGSPVSSSYSNDTRQSVLMWGSPLTRSGGHTTVHTTAGLLDSKLNKYGDSISRTMCELTSVSPSVCKWSGHVATPKSASPHNSTSPASGKVAPSVTYSSTCYPPSIGLEIRHPVPLLRQENGRPPPVKHDGNPLLSISEVTNTLLNHD